MTTLYDLLGALPDDGADGLRAAFRRPKANHPDVNPGDPEAAERFRRIVRANAILSDDQQRVAYDRLLEVARRQQSPKPKRSNFSGTIRRLAADAIASIAVSVVLIGGYLLFSLSRAAHRFDAGDRGVQAQAAPAPAATKISDTHGRTGQHDQLAVVGADMKFDVSSRGVEAPAKPDGIAPAATTGIAPEAPLLPARDFGTKDAKYYRERGILAYRSGDLYIALANFDLAIIWILVWRIPTSSRHCLPPPGRPEARIFRRRRGQAHRKFESKQVPFGGTRALGPLGSIES